MKLKIPRGSTYHKITEEIKDLYFSIFSDLNNQKVINQFIDFCKTYEDQDGLLKREFFLKFLKTKGQFTSGPFKNIFFEVLEQNDKELKVLLDNYKHPIVINKDQSIVGIDFI